MPTNLSPLSPPVAVGDKLVHVGVISWGGFKAVLDAVAQADLPLPKLAAERLGGALAELQTCSQAAAQESDPQCARLAAQQANARLYELVATLLAENLDTLARWLLAHPPIVAALVRGASNLSAEEVERLPATQLLRVARGAWSALVADGFFTEAAGFFGELVGLRPANRPTNASPPPSRRAGTGPVSPSDSTSP